MKKHHALLIALLACSGCGIISKQYYYVPSVAHQTIKGYFSHTDFKMISNRFSVSNKVGDSVGSIAVSNGIGHPLLMGLLLPVMPVGGFFQKSSSQFVMEVTVNSNEGYFMPLAIDSNDYKSVRDSLHISKVSTKRPLQSNQCYMIVNDTLKVPLKVGEFFMGHTGAHSYWMTADIRFRKVKSLKLITGNTLLDSTLNHVTFKRRSRIKFDLVGPGY
ncbi:hypothetical protein [Mucilaginibacter dorajii]|uniref:Lipoprotein n=1 Tax=Mucilaginibacter dorajii TaxID=692994 RepID=A0ABP7QCU4_9SPHI|nr:hypothetical protein [Mucilaginibacter dorajii]MCS3733189.1 hypothetical protein [Mucilaginibacter dorajii]